MQFRRLAFNQPQVSITVRFYKIWACKISWKDFQKLTSNLLPSWKTSILTLQKTAFENMEGKGENAANQHFLLFQQCFLSFQIQFLNCESSMICFLLMLSIWTFYFLVNLFQNKPWFLHVCSKSHLKTLWEKEKLLVTSNFSFSHNVFYPFGKLSAIFIKCEIVVCKVFQFQRV